MKVTEFGKDWQPFAGFVALPEQKDLTYFGTFVNFADKMAVVSDEIYWNMEALTGDNLAGVSKALQGKGFETGVTITPAVLFNVDWTTGTSTPKPAEEVNGLITKMLQDISAVDFVAVDPYKGLIPGVSDDFLLSFTHMADEMIHSLGKKALLVVQGFARHGEEQDTLDFIKAQVEGQTYDEVVIFGLEDAPDLQTIDFVGINPLPILEGI